MSNQNPNKKEKSLPLPSSIVKQIPHNTEAEIAVLACMLLDQDMAFDVAISKLNFPNSFYHPAHQKIFTSLIQMRDDKNCAVIDLVTFSSYLDKAGVLEDIGGRGYLGEIIASLPTAANIEEYCEIVHQNAVLRKLIHTSNHILHSCFEPAKDIRQMLDDIEKEILGVTNLNSSSNMRTVSDMMMGALEHLENLNMQKEEATGIPTRYSDLDNLLTGLRPMEMIVLAARPSIGKTAFALNIALNIATRKDNPCSVGIFSLEMGAEQLVLRLLCSHARINMGDIREGALNKSHWHNIMDAGSELREANIVIDDTGGIDIVELRARARRMKREHDVDCIMIDYLQLLKATGGANSNRENEVAMMSGGIKNLAKELNIPIIVLAQLNRQAEQDGAKPKLGHLRESGAIEQDADVVMLLHRDRNQQIDAGTELQCVPAEVIVAKHRNGPTGAVPMVFFPAYTRFESKSRFDDE